MVRRMNEKEKTDGEENAREDLGRGKKHQKRERERERGKSKDAKKEKKKEGEGEERSTLGRRGGWGMAHATRHHNGIMRQRR